VKISRRDFMKLAALAQASLMLPGSVPRKLRRAATADPALPNVIFLVFDTMSAYHLSLYGYPRRNTPNLERFAQRANAYHAHYSAANFTVPGTSSLLTGLHPWTHRALHMSGLVSRDLTEQNIFELIGPDYHRLAFSQNLMATNLLHQFRAGIDELLPTSSFSELSFVVSEYFPNDQTAAHQALDNVLFDFVDPSGSLLLGLAQRLDFAGGIEAADDRNYPRGIPQPLDWPMSYKLVNVFNGLMDRLDGLAAPFFSYIHIFSPHAPYRAHKNFVGLFEDGWTQIRKPESIFSRGSGYKTTERIRLRYDEYIANVDFEFGRLLDHLEKTGRLEDSYVVLTSDHGELLERGVRGHVTPLLYEPLVRVPLLISSPGQRVGRSIHLPTSSVDILPTLLTLTGRAVPDWAEGRLLPGLGGVEDPERPVYMLEAKTNSAFAGLTKATFAMRKGKYKIIMYRGYEVFDGDRFELYDLENDPQEMVDLFVKQAALANEMRNEMIVKFGK
jgi:arylsulfatase A-like enzyme